MSDRRARAPGKTSTFAGDEVRAAVVDVHAARERELAILGVVVRHVAVVFIPHMESSAMKMVFSPGGKTARPSSTRVMRRRATDT